MAYGTVKVDNITFDNGGSDQNVTVSGLYRATTSGVTLSGTIVAATVSGVTIIGSTTVSGATVTGTTANFTSGNFSNIISSAATMSGALIMANQQQVRFREAVGNGVNHIALQAPAIVSADQTITLPDQTGTVVTTGDNGSVTSTMILDGTILNVDINASAGIVDTKLATIATAGKVSNSATTATNANTASAIVARDASGNFTAGTITAALTGAASSNVLKAGDTMTGVLAVTAGTAALPGLAIASDLDTGIYSPGADQLAVSTGGTGRLFVASDGKVGIGTASPAVQLHVNGTGFVSLNITSDSTSETQLRFLTNTAARITNQANTALIFDTNALERARITSAGNVGIGTTSPAELLNVNGNIALDTAVLNTPKFLQFRANSDGTGTPSYGGITWYNFQWDATKRAEISSGPDGGVAAGYLAFSTGSTGITERMRISAAGNVGIGTSSPQQVLHVTQSGGNNFAGIRSHNSNTGTGIAGIEFSSDSTYAKSAIGLVRADTNGVGSLVFYNASSTGAANWSTADERLRITSAGNVGIGTSSPVTALDVEGGARFGAQNTTTLPASNSNGGAQFFFNRSAGSAETNIINLFENAPLSFDFLQKTGASTANSLYSFGSTTHIWYTNNTERARIDSSGRLLVGTSTSVDDTFGPSSIQVSTTGGNAASFSRYSADAFTPIAYFRKSRGALNTQGLVSSGDSIGALIFTGSDGTGFIQGATIIAAVDGTPGTNDMPGRLVFSTTADGAASPTERLRITSAGVLQVADAGNITVGTTTGTKIGTATTQKLSFYNATPVVQPTAVADATDAATVITQLNALLTRMRNLGLIAT